MALYLPQKKHFGRLGKAGFYLTFGGFALATIGGLISIRSSTVLIYVPSDSWEDLLIRFWEHQCILRPDGRNRAEKEVTVRKFVVSGTLEEPLGWNNSTLIEGDVFEGVVGLKSQPGKDITIIGSGELVRSLLEEGLLDELRLMVH
ncbi:MAG TPA: dihydrofolate reductase family protein, partial [Rubrobacteraceae bacterium]|nr:dihydrofolate reductase family protein [Rubrobacteraceae bacterium]